MLQSTFNPGLTLTGFRTTRPSRILGLLGKDKIWNITIPLIKYSLEWWHYFGEKHPINQVFDTAILDCNWMLDC